MKVKLQHIAFTLLLITSAACGKRSTDWFRYYESQYKSPYGTYILVEELEHQFPYSYVDKITGKLNESMQDYLYNDNTAYLYINSTIYHDSSEIQQLLQFADQGNSVFISSTNFNQPVLASFGIEISNYAGSKHQLSLETPDGIKSCEIETRSGSFHFFSKVTENSRILERLGSPDSKLPVLITIPRRNGGRLYFHSEPILFTNYHLLNKEVGPFAFETISVLKHTENFLWDNYHTRRRYTQADSNGENEGMLRFILRNPSLANALYIFALIVVLFLTFNYKRIIRPLPIFKKPENNSLEFMKMVARLFMYQDNHIDLARSRINFVLDQIKNKYHLDTSVTDEQFQFKLAQKSGLKPPELENLVWQINTIRQLGTLNKNDFIAFNSQLEKNIKKLDLYHGRITT
ncbi:DUF4350 domain-containing protein [bacterium]|nr:DUF4350 domain-containing protein [bacterium]